MECFEDMEDEIFKHRVRFYEMGPMPPFVLRPLLFPGAPFPETPNPFATSSTPQPPKYYAESAEDKFYHWNCFKQSPITEDPMESRESAAQLLYMNIKWAKAQKKFQSLCIDDRLILLQETWKDLFVLGAVQFLYPFNSNLLMSRTLTGRDMDRIQLFQVAMEELATIKPLDIEFTCLRNIILYYPQAGQNKLVGLERVFDSLETNLYALYEYSSITQHEDDRRGHNLVSMLNFIHHIPQEIIIELYFEELIANIPMEKVIRDIYKTA